jgi:hypothetical protein
VTAVTSGSSIVPVKGASSTDLFIEEYGDEWPLEMVRISSDDFGPVLEVFVLEERADEMRRTCPPKYEGHWTVVIGVPLGWGGLSEEASA